MVPKNDVSLSGFLAEGNVVCGLENMDRSGVIDELVKRLARNVGGFDEEAAREAIEAREKLAPTVVAPGIAMPHARMGSLSRPLMAVGLSSEGFTFEGEDEPVQIVVLVLTSKSDPGAYLRLVAAVSKALSDEELKKSLLESESSRQAYSLLVRGDVILPDHLVARDVMNPNPMRVMEGDSLSDAIEMFCTRRVLDLPVVDDVNDLRGVISVEDLLRLSLPEHFLWMDDLSPILDFEPFAETLKKDDEMRIADFMREEYIAVEWDTPAIQVAKIFQMSKARQILVVEDGQLMGALDLASFISQLYWA